MMYDGELGEEDFANNGMFNSEILKKIRERNEHSNFLMKVMIGLGLIAVSMIATITTVLLKKTK